MSGSSVPYFADLEQIIVKIRAHNPKTTVLLSTLINNWAENIVINKRMPEVAQKLSTTDSRIVLVDNATGFVYPDDAVDGCHPNPQGEEKMAVKWFEGSQGRAAQAHPVERKDDAKKSEVMWWCSN